MNQVCGKVLLKETNVGIPDLLVEIYDVDPGTRPEEILRVGVPTGTAATPASSAGVAGANRLGAGATMDGGGFEVKYEDEDFRRRDPAKQRPNLWLLVRAPEEMDSLSTANILHVSKDIRENAERETAYIIRISTEKLLAAGISVPTSFTLEVEEPEAVIQKVKLSVARQVKIKEEVQKIAAEQVEAERQRTAQMDKEVENRLLEKLTGVPDKLAERLNYVPPGANVESAMFRTLNKSIEETINKNPPAKGYIVLSEKQAKKFKKRDGTFRDDIPAAEIKPYLFGSADDSQRPTFLIRENPADVTRPSQPTLTLIEPDVNNVDRNDSGNDGQRAMELGLMAATPPPNGAHALTAVPETIPDFVGRLIGTMTSPEEAVTFGVKPRPTQDTIEGEISDFEMHSGPADVPSFYDFHSLQIAFDYVWQKAIDEGVIESTKILSQQLQDMGGDPIAAMSNGTDPIKALRNELRIVQTAHTNSNLTPILSTVYKGSARMLQPDGNGSSNGKKVLEGYEPHFFPGDVGNGVDKLITKDQADAARRNELLPHELLNQIETLLNQRFAFEIFAPGSVNFGILVTYRQRWVPLNYQVGNLAKTLTLTPKETRKVTAKRVVKKERSVKEMENSLRVRKEESNNTGRDEAEIIAKAEAKTNFNLTAKGAYNLGIGSGDATTIFGKDAATNSSDTKKAFREAVIKAAQEYKDERKLEVETKESFEEEYTESTEITNPNDELTVTYLFYELQRRYKISEQIHRLTPVVLVAMDVPNPSRQAIDALLLTYGWIIDRVLLDDQFHRPLEYFRTKLVGEEVALTEMKQNLAVMRDVVEELKRSYTKARDRSNTLSEQLLTQMAATAQTAESSESESSWWDVAEVVINPYGAVIHKAADMLSQPDTQGVEGARIMQDVARERYERAVNQERELRAQLESETAALKSASDAYAKAQAEHLNCLMDVGTLCLHIKENILYYMQAIWSHTFKDQIFLALHKKKVPRLTPHEQSYSLSQPTEAPISVPVKAGEIVLEVEAKAQFESGLDPDKDFVTLAEVADLDNLLGFKGNYMIFPLLLSNLLTDWMMIPFVDRELGLRDPDEFGNFTPEEFVAYAHALHEEMRQQLQNGEITEEELQAAIDRLSDQFRRLLSAPRRAEDEIIVPTGSLYIEARPGAHPILEDFKLMHRAIDVKKVQAEVRKLEMENIRYAARVLDEEYEDPDIERKVVISGNGQAIVVPPVEN